MQLKKQSFHILVTDTNLHVRTLLKRELEQEGHIIHLAKNKKEAQIYIHGNSQIDIVILDPELPDCYGHKPLLEQIQDRTPPVKVIIHTFAEFFDGMSFDKNVYCVEKSAVSIAPLKRRILSFDKLDTL